jgi:hypothetical protein
MSLYLDQKYLSLISNRLPLFKKKSDSLYNCRCIICGDSLKNPRKARGYFYHIKNDLRYKCHNCNCSMAFSTFLKQIDHNLYSQYVVERYADKQPPAQEMPVFTPPEFKKNKETLLDNLLERLDKLPEDHEAVIYCKARKIPEHRYQDIYFIPNIKDIVQLNSKYSESIVGEEPRIIFPFYNNQLQLSGVTCRAIRGEALRYITVKIKEEDTLIFNLDKINKSRTVYCVEGPIDSLFLENAIAANGTSFEKINEIGIGKDKLVFIFDNQPRNKEVCSIIKKNIDKGYNVVIWPQTVEQKDINQMIEAGKNVNSIIKNNVVSGLTAQARFMAWKRC